MATNFIFEEPQAVKDAEVRWRQMLAYCYEKADEKWPRDPHRQYQSVLEWMWPYTEIVARVRAANPGRMVVRLAPPTPEDQTP